MNIGANRPQSATPQAMGDQRQRPAVSVVIPTYCREQVLIDTIQALRAQCHVGDEVVVVDQTPKHEATVDAGLQDLDRVGAIRWLRRAQPSIPAAMNAGLLAARNSVVIFVDDDIIPFSGFLDAHAEFHAAVPAPAIMAGRVLQPWHIDGSVAHEGHASVTLGPCTEFMGGNFSVDRETALRLGGFDERFVKVAYRFEAEFGLRAQRAGVGIEFNPQAALHHLRASSGGTRSYGDHLRMLLPMHSVGEYYYLFGSRPSGWWRRAVARPMLSVRTRHHLRRPWWIPVTLLSEFAGIGWALVLAARGPALLSTYSQ